MDNKNQPTFKPIKFSETLLREMLLFFECRWKICNQGSKYEALGIKKAIKNNRHFGDELSNNFNGLRYKVLHYKLSKAQ